jgi:lipopolysaccharide export system permease protein
MIVTQMLPAAILLASLMTCGYMSRHGEITAMKANGISLYRLAFPILTVAS